MNCEEAQQHWLAAIHDRTDPSAAPGHAHMSTCSACRTFMARSSALDAVLRHDTNTEPRPGFDTRFFARLKEHQQAPSRARRMGWGLALAGALALFVAGLFWLRAPPQVAVPATELALAMDLDLLQEDTHMLADLRDVEDFMILEHLPPDALREAHEQ